MDYGLSFHSEKIVQTKYGTRLLRVAKPTDDFWRVWRERKEALKRAGYSVSKDDAGNWRVEHWSEPRQSLDTTASYATDADIAVPAPSGLEYMPFQRAGIAYALSKRNALIADEPGLGKTIQAIGLLNALPENERKRVLIVVPAYLRLNWQAELHRWLAFHASIHIDSLNASEGIIVASYERVTKFVKEAAEKKTEIKPFDVAICDEAHYLKNPKAQRTKAVLRGIKASRWLFLTGTPVLNRPVELWPLLTKLDPNGLGNSWKHYVVRYCAAKMTKWGWDVSGASNTDELNQLLRGKCMIRRLKKDVLRELPAKIRKRVYLDPADSRELEQAFAREREIFQALVAEFGSLENALKQKGLGGLEELTKARHAVALAKIPLACQYILEALEEANQLVIFVWHRDVAYTLRDCLEQSQVSCVMATGDMSTEARHESVKAFQAGLARVFIGTIAAAGTGVTLTAASRVIFIEEAWQPGVVVQAEDRIHRIGQEADSVFAEHLIVQGSVDEMIVNQLDSKSSIIGSILDSDNAKLFSEE